MKNKIDQEIIFKQYAILIESTEKLSDRRMMQNNIFTTINLAFLTALFSVKITGMVLSYSAVLGIIISFVWILTIYNYKIRNKVKFEIINEIERKYFYNIYNNEHIKIVKENNLFSLTTYEFFLASIFLIIYFIVYFASL